MASINKRKQLVNQLRKAHFPFGFQKRAQGANSDARKNNFTIGNKNDINNDAYQSEFKDRYKNFDLNGKPDPIKNSQDKNIIFGYDDPADKGYYKSNYKDDYDKKERVGGDQVKPLDQRKPNIEFGDSLNDFATTYGKVHDKKPLQGNQADIGKPENRKSHLMLGNDKNSFQTQHSAAYKNIPGQKYYVHKQSNNSNIQLGSGSTNYASENRHNYYNKGADRSVVDKDKIKDFRSAHFDLGFPDKGDPVGQSEHKAQYGQKPFDPVKGENKRASNINFNVDGNNYFESSYGKQYQDWGPVPRAQMNKNGRVDNVLIGTDGDTDKMYLSQAKQNYGAKDLNPVRAQPIKPEGSLVLGQVGNDFRTHYKMTHDDKFPHLQSNKLSQQDINRMKKNSVVTGFQDGLYNLHSKDYGKRQGAKGQLSKETLDKMRNTNIVLETVPMRYEFAGNTTYNNSFPNKVNEDY